MSDFKQNQGMMSALHRPDDIAKLINFMRANMKKDYAHGWMICSFVTFVAFCRFFAFYFAEICMKTL